MKYRLYYIGYIKEHLCRSMLMIYILDVDETQKSEEEMWTRLFGTI